MKRICAIPAGATVRNVAAGVKIINSLKVGQQSGIMKEMSVTVSFASSSATNEDMPHAMAGFWL